MNRFIEIEFSEDVYADWKLVKKVLNAITKGGKVKSIGDYKCSRETMRKMLQEEKE